MGWDSILAIPAETYWASKIPCPEDEQIAQLCEAYQRSMSPQERRSFAQALTLNAQWVLGAFSTRAAMLGVRQKEARWLILGIVALTILLETPHTDWREILIDLSVLHHSARKLGNVREVFERGTEHVENEEVRQLLLGYLERDPKDQRIEVMGWEEVEGPSGVIYRFGGQPIPEGHLY